MPRSGWATWEPTYREILQDFGYARADDEAARDELAALAARHARPDRDALRARFDGREVLVAGPLASGGGTGAPERPERRSDPSSSSPALRRFRPSGPPAERVVVATDASTWAFDEAEIIVTDLDGDVAAQLEANARGVPLFVHAHGDNRAALARWVPQMRGPVQPTTQAAPTTGVENFGGFTDGDRACCLAVALGARSLALAGFDFEHPVAKPGRDADMKRRKLAWARRIIDSLGVPVRMA